MLFCLDIKEGEVHVMCHLLHRALHKRDRGQNQASLNPVSSFSTCAMFYIKSCLGRGNKALISAVIVTSQLCYPYVHFLWCWEHFLNYEIEYHSMIES